MSCRIIYQLKHSSNILYYGTHEFLRNEMTIKIQCPELRRRARELNNE